MKDLKKPPPLEDEPAEVRIQKGLALILSALPELIYRYLTNRKK